jgi:hypothetical protein
MLMIATPLYGGLATKHYLESVVALTQALTLLDIAHDFLWITNESLIPRGRNTCAATFLKSDYTHLLFIDGDIGFKVEDVIELYKLAKPLAVAAYPMKRDDAPLAAWRDGKLLTFADMDTSAPFTVDYAGTGFMLIRREVFAALQDAHPEWRYEESYGEAWAFFQDPIEDGIHLSEDYFFCKRYREIGGEVWMQPSIRLVHVGTKAYGEPASS